ncbi:hypothetical protein LL037_24455 [Clostridium estertheticum]|uniref:Uncharacterized protein n=1 Tax=Clostridium estertheticum TaxID=238834 RepID=A0AA47EHN8_9CLOT|nr:hypothetical protein [Clostridium estertheticum]MBU3155319.1 hypothetical protein [Clostridium estertheticum]MBU3197745.1 hypothetical protein [Clostridium estertheticum]WAG60377.1 hypothetical protein LL038_23110 [Clostridium estertheticum]WAG65547.1 hypothetical protein LL037_24455 [Clostridium estertheticum]
MNKKIIGSFLAAVMIAGTTSISAFGAMGSGTVVIGTKAFDLSYANDPANFKEIASAIVDGGMVYVKNFDGKWINNINGLATAISSIPAVIYKNATEKISFDAADLETKVTTTINSATKILAATQAVIKAEISKVQTDVDTANTLVNALLADTTSSKIKADLLSRLSLIKVTNVTTPIVTTPSVDITAPILNSVALTIGQSVSAIKDASGNFKVSLAAAKATDMFTAVNFNTSEKATVKVTCLGRSKTFTINDSGNLTIPVADLLGSYAPSAAGISVGTLKNYLSLLGNSITLNATLTDASGNASTKTIIIAAN